MSTAETHISGAVAGGGSPSGGDTGGASVSVAPNSSNAHLSGGVVFGDAIDTFSRVVPAGGDPVATAPAEINGWGDTEIAGAIGWIEDWGDSGAYTSPAEFVDGEEGGIDLMAGATFITSNPSIYPTGIIDAAESAAAGLSMYANDVLTFSYDMKYTINGDANNQYQSMWVSAQHGFLAGDGITGSFYDFRYGPSPHRFMGIEIETFNIWDTGHAPDPDYAPRSTKSRHDLTNFDLEFIINDSRGVSYLNPGYHFKWGDLIDCNDRWISSEFLIDAYGTHAESYFRDDPGGQRVFWGEYSDVPELPMGVVGLPVASYDADGAGGSLVANRVPPFNAVGFLEIDGMNWGTFRPSAATMKFDNFKIGSAPLLGGSVSTV